MNNEIFQHARQAYQEHDYETALGSFTQCLQEDPESLRPGEMGLLYHQIGNCLVKLNDFNEAIHAYTQATADNAYEACGIVNYNLGMAYAALHDYEDAVRHFEIAVSDSNYKTPYKAYTGMGNAYLKLGKSAEAGAAFRSSALDEANPDPTKNLLNLGICFMALNRPMDAVAYYESALQFHMKPATRNKLYANLGQAYVATGQMQKAASAFEMSLADKTYFLSDSASVDYQRAIAALSTGTTSIPPVAPPSLSAVTPVVKPDPQPAVQTVEASAAPAVEDVAQPTQAIAVTTPANDMSGLDISADGSPVANDAQVTTIMDPCQYPEAEIEGEQLIEEPFFQATDEELEQWSKGVAKKKRKKHNTGLKVFLVILILLIALVGAGVFAYTQGYGYPSQETVAKELFTNPDQNAGEVFAGSVTEEQRNSMLPMVVRDENATVDGVENNMTTSNVFVTAHTSDGGDIHYKVTMVRDGIGWKINTVDLYFASQN